MDQPDNIQLKKTPGKLLVHTPGHGSYLTYIRHLVGDLARQCGFPDAQVAEIEMSVDEACSNIVKHAYAPQSKWARQHRHPEIHLSVNVENNQLIIEINDHGQRFDFAMYRPEDIDLRLREMKTNGYGISIMRKFMDEVSYTSSDATGNTLRLVKYLKKS